MTTPAPPPNPKAQLRKTMGFWDVLLFNIATVLGPRWIAAAGHNGPSSISLWILAAVFFFVPGAFVINELSSRFPEEGGLYAWARDAFGPFHGFIAGWTYWIYTVFYFPGLLLASASMVGCGSGKDEGGVGTLSLPLVSAGGSGLIITCAALGLMYSVTRSGRPAAPRRVLVVEEEGVPRVGVPVTG